MANISTTSIRFRAGDSDAMGFLAWSEDELGQPGLIVLQEFWGLNDHIKEVTRRLAAEGFVALAPDMYDGKVTTDPTEARKCLHRWIRPRRCRSCRVYFELWGRRIGYLPPGLNGCAMYFVASACAP